MKVTFGKINKHRKFEMKTRYYDEKKEAEEKRKKEIEDNIKNPDRINIRKEIRKKWVRDDRTRAKSKKYALYFYIFVLIIVLYFILR
ncbi:MAG: hypothetical protein DRI74_03790 [Bacteroidetes bacterium]|nr:MAG: hypothetical protein DRI74_03790 [Bacteroidota bacterium]